MAANAPILVPLDASPLAETATAHAVALARALHVPLAFLSVAEDAASAPMPADARRGASDYLASYLEAMRQRVGVPDATISVKFGEPADAIVAAADEVGACMIVVASHGRSGLSRWAYGSTASQVIRAANVPVLVIVPDALARSGEDVTIRSILLPLDGSPLAEHALPVADAIAQATDARVILARIERPAAERFPYVPPTTIWIPQLDHRLRDDAVRYLEERRQALRATADVETVVIDGAPAPALIELAHARRVDLVIMTTRARVGLARAVLGSTADRMLRGPAPVLLVPPIADLHWWQARVGRATRTA